MVLVPEEFYLSKKKDAEILQNVDQLPNYYDRMDRERRRNMDGKPNSTSLESKLDEPSYLPTPTRIDPYIPNTPYTPRHAPSPSIKTPRTIDRFKSYINEELEAGQGISSDDLGRLVVRGRRVKGSNVEDLINFLNSDRKKTMPVGMGPLLEYLASINTPTSLIRNHSARKLLQLEKVNLHEGDNVDWFSYHQEP